MQNKFKLSSGQPDQPFSHWLYEQVGREDPIGDLAADARDDADWPEGISFAYYYFNYLVSKRACPEALEAFLAAWEEWCGYRPFVSDKFDRWIQEVRERFEEQIDLAVESADPEVQEGLNQASDIFRKVFKPSHCF